MNLSLSEMVREMYRVLEPHQAPFAPENVMHGALASYNPQQDTISISSHVGPEDDHILLHELMHWTGPRTGRSTFITSGNLAYEELVANAAAIELIALFSPEESWAIRKLENNYINWLDLGGNPRQAFPSLRDVCDGRRSCIRMLKQRAHQEAHYAVEWLLDQMRVKSPLLSPFIKGTSHHDINQSKR